MSGNNFTRRGSWLTLSNFNPTVNKDFQAQSHFKGMATKEASETPGQSSVLRYDDQTIKEHIKMYMHEQVTTKIEGINDLKAKANDGSLRQGMLIFEELSLSEALDVTGIKAKVCGFFPRMIKEATLHQIREFSYFNCAVFVGSYDGIYFVVENGVGKTKDDRFGTINVLPIEDAFSKDSTFFLVSPQRDEFGESRRYIVLQRALASVGVGYRYSMRAVSSESFALMVIVLFEEAITIQQDASKTVNKGSLKDSIKGMESRGAKTYDELYESVMRKIEAVKKGIRLTLPFLLKNALQPLSYEANLRQLQSTVGCWTNHWKWRVRYEFITEMEKSYEGLINAILMEDKEAVVKLVNLGLDLGVVTDYGKTPLTIAASKGLADNCTALLNEVDPLYTGTLHHKDGNRHEALEYAELYNHPQTYNALTKFETRTPEGKMTTRQ